MQPQQTYYTPPPQPNQRHNKFVVIGMVLGVIMVIFIIIALILSGSDYADKMQLFSANQAEVIRTSELAINSQNSSPNTKALASTIKINTASNINAMNLLGYSATKNQLSEALDTNTDSILEQAKNNNSFNDTFSEIMQTKISSTLNTLNQILKADLSDNERVIVEQILNDQQLLLESI